MRGYRIWADYVDVEDNPLEVLNRLVAELINTVDDLRLAVGE